MALIDPYPGHPIIGDPLDPVTVKAKFDAIFQGIQSFDGTQIANNTVFESALANSVNPRLRDAEAGANFVYTGLIWSLVSGLNGTMSGGTVYINGYRVVVNSIGSHGFTASKDTYIDVDYVGNVYYLEVANGATAPGLTSNAIRIARIVTNGTTITATLQQGFSDGLGNIIYPTGGGSAKLMQNPVKFSIYAASAWTTGNNVDGQVPFNTVDFDTGHNCNTTSTYRFTAPITGFYQISFMVTTDTLTGAGIAARCRVNGNTVMAPSMVPVGYTGAFGTALGGSKTLKLAANDYVDAVSYAGGQAGQVGSNATYLTGFLISTS